MNLSNLGTTGIVGLVLAVVGFIVIFASDSMAKRVWKDNEEIRNKKAFIIKIVGAAIMLVAATLVFEIWEVFK